MSVRLIVGRLRLAMAAMLAGFALLAPTLGAHAQPAPRMPMNGVWIIEDDGIELYSELALAISHQWAGIGHKTVAAPLHAAGVAIWKKQSHRSRVTGKPELAADGTVTMRFGQFGFCQCRRVFYTVKPTGDPNLLRGEWVYRKGDGREIKRGTSLWRRLAPAEIQSVSYAIASADPEQRFTRRKVSNAITPLLIDRALTPGLLWITIAGKRLAGGHNLLVESDVGALELAKVGWLCADGRFETSDWGKCGSVDGIGDGVVGMRLGLRAGEKLAAGPGTIWLNGQAIRFQISDGAGDAAGALNVEIQPGARDDAKTGRPINAAITVANTGGADVFNPVLEIKFAGAVDKRLELKAFPHKKRTDAEAQFFDIACEVRDGSAKCPLGYGDELKDGRRFLAAGAAVVIDLEAVSWKPGRLTVAATATGRGEDGSEVRDSDSAAWKLKGPILGLALLGAEPAAVSEVDGLPVHPGRELVLRYAVANSSKAGDAHDVLADFRNRAGEVLSVSAPATGSAKCSQNARTSYGRSHMDCSLGKLAAGENIVIEARYRYGVRLNAEASVSAEGSERTHRYETGVDIRPAVVATFDPRASSTVTPGQSISATFEVLNRGVSTVPGATLRLSLARSDHPDAKIAEAEGCLDLKFEGRTALCRLPAFSAEAPVAIAVKAGVPTADDAVGGELDFAWSLELPGRRAQRQKSNEAEGFAVFPIVVDVADLYVSDLSDAPDIERGRSETIFVLAGNKGPAEQIDVEVSFRLEMSRETGAVSKARHLKAAALSNRSRPGKAPACKLSGDVAVCVIRLLPPRTETYLEFEIDAGDIDKGFYRYAVEVGEGFGEDGDNAYLKNNRVSALGLIAPVDRPFADLRVFRDQADQAAYGNVPETLDFWVANDGNTTQANVVFKMDFNVEAEDGAPAERQVITDAYALLVGGEAGASRRVPCALGQGTASCALGTLPPDEMAHVIVEWRTPAVSGRYRYAAYVGEGVGERELDALANNKVAGGGDLKAPTPAKVTSAPASARKVATLDFPLQGDKLRWGFSALGRYENLAPGEELWLSVCLKPETDKLLRKADELLKVELQDVCSFQRARQPVGASGVWSIHGVRPSGLIAALSTVRHDAFRIGISIVQPDAAARLRQSPNTGNDVARFAGVDTHDRFSVRIK